MKHFSTRETARILEATEAQVRSYARLGQVVPQLHGHELTFSFQDLLVLRTTKGLIDSGVPSRRLRRAWTSLRRQLPQDVPLTSVTMSAVGDRAVACDGESRWAPESGQFLLDLDATIAATQHADERERPEEIPAIEAIEGGARVAGAPVFRLVVGGASVASMPSTAPRRARRGAVPIDASGTPASPPLTADQWFQLGCELEEDSPSEARQAYLQALDIEPGYADAHLNLGRHYHESGELGKAEVHYRDAVRWAPEDATAHFNLGVLLEDRGRRDEAIHAYRQAIARDAEAADAHYNLGLLLESMGRRADAISHLMRARELYEG